MKKLTPVIGILSLLFILGKLDARAQCANVVVTSNPLWTNTGISVTNGQMLTINATGFWSFNTFPPYPAPFAGPDGVPTSDSGDVFLLDSYQGGLIAYIGTADLSTDFGSAGGPYPQSSANGFWDIGSAAQFISDTSGTLWLGFNDATVTHDVIDNAGTATASISVGPGPGCSQCTAPAMSIPAGSLSDLENTFTFGIIGPSGSQWNLYQSSDLVNWSLISSVSFGPVSLFESGTPALRVLFTDNSISGVNCRFYRVSNGNCCSQAIGFTRQTILPGLNLVANQLNWNSDTLDNLFNPMPDGTTLPTGAYVLTYAGSDTFNTYTWGGSSWSPSGSAMLPPGLSFFIDNPTTNSFTVSFAGLVTNGNLSLPIPTGDNDFISSILPEAGYLSSTLNLIPHNGSIYYFWDASIQNWLTYNYTHSSWSPGEPTLTVGQGFAVLPSATNDWIETYSTCSGSTPCTPPVLTNAVISSTDFSFDVIGVPNTYWNLYESTDLVNWTWVQQLRLNSSFDDNTISGVNYRFYRVSNGNCCSQPLGFIRQNCEAGYNYLLANQLIETNNTLDGLFNPLPDGTYLPDEAIIKTQIPGTWSFNTYEFAESGYCWDGGAGSNILSDGEGFFISATSSFTLTFVGWVPEGTLTLPVSTNSVGELAGSMSSQAGGITSALNYVPNLGDSVSLWDPASWSWGATYTYSSGGWSPGEPVLCVAQGFLLDPATDNTWSQTNSCCSGSTSCTAPMLTNATNIIAGGFTNFGFNLSGGDAYSYWNIYDSADLVNWNLIAGITTDGSGNATFNAGPEGLISYRFYRVSNGNCCSQPIGFIKLNILPGLNLIANQLIQPDDSLNGLFKPMSDGTTLPTGAYVLTYAGSDTFNTYTWGGSSWSPSGSPTLPPGLSFFIDNPTTNSFTVTFIGLVPEGTLSLPIPTGDNDFISSILPQTGYLSSTLNLIPNHAGTYYFWDASIQAYSIYNYIHSSWSPGEPTLTVGQGFAVWTSATNDWIETFMPPCP